MALSRIALLGWHLTCEERSKLIEWFTSADAITSPDLATYHLAAAAVLGHLTTAANGSSTSNYSSFDVMGNVLASSQATAGQTYSFTYGYNLAGALTSETYPSGRTVTTGYDGANRPLTVTGAFNGQSTPYAYSASYWPQGSLYSYGAANGVVPAWTYDSRLHMNSFWATIANDPSRYLMHN